MSEPRSLTVEVIQEDIDNGNCADSHSCAFALAMARTLGHDVNVGAWSARDLTTGDDWSLSGTTNPFDRPRPHSAYYFIGRFDHDRGVKPATFTLWELVGDDIS